MSPNPDLRFEVDGWAEGTSPDGHSVFVRAPDDILVARAFDIPPDLVSPLGDLPALYEHLRGPLDEAGASLLSIGALAIDGVPALEMIFEAQDESAGTIYVGALTIPFRDGSFVIKVMCRDSGSDELPLERLRDHLDRLCATATLSERAKQLPRFGT
ncbi:MAG TPA: hypothetical protein VM261_35915 [Kofleriaceae bacterium]|nr:hypothetical protein [Kofleriaceae bacterium]